MVITDRFWQQPSLGLLSEWVIYIGVADDLGMTVGDDSDGDKGSAVMSGGGGGFVNSTRVGGLVTGIFACSLELSDSSG